MPPVNKDNIQALLVCAVVLHVGNIDERCLYVPDFVRCVVKVHAQTYQ